MKFDGTLLVLDLDGTITKTDNLVQFSLFMLNKQKRMKFLLIFPMLFLLKLQAIDNRDFKVLYARLILQNFTVQYLNECVDKFIETKFFKCHVNNHVIEFINKYSDSEKIVISANYSFIVAPVLRFLEIRNQISIELDTKEDIYTGKVIGPIPFGKYKINALKQYLINKNISKTIGLADSKSDLPLLKFLDEGYLVKFDDKSNKTDFKRIKCNSQA